MESSPFITLAAGLIIFVAFFIRSLTGFGSALIGVPLLAMIFELKFAVPLEALLEMGLSAMLLCKVYQSINKSVIFPLIIGAIIGSLIGAYVLHSFANIYLKRALGVTIILFALHLFTRKKDHTVKPLSYGLGVAAGGIGGVLGGIFGTSGVAFVMYLSYRLPGKDILRASLIGLFTIDYAWRVGIYTANGLLSLAILKFALLLTPALILGTILGHKVHFKISEIRYRQIVSAILLISGIFLLIQ